LAAYWVEQQLVFAFNSPDLKNLRMLKALRLPPNRQKATLYLDHRPRVPCRLFLAAVPGGHWHTDLRLPIGASSGDIAREKTDWFLQELLVREVQESKQEERLRLTQSQLHDRLSIRGMRRYFEQLGIESCYIAALQPQPGPSSCLLVYRSDPWLYIRCTCVNRGS
jgi:hypothetical protein